MADSDLSFDLEQPHSPAKALPPTRTSHKHSNKRSKRDSAKAKPSSPKGRFLG